MRTAPRILATRLWCRHAFQASGAATHTEFIQKFECYASPETGYGLDPRLLRAWETGRRYVSEGSVHRVESRVPGTQYVFAIGELLRRQPLSAPAARRVFEDYFVARPGGRVWRLPCDVLKGNTGNDVASYAWNDSAALASRGDFLGFLSILVLLHESTAQWNSDSGAEHAKNLYTALPSVLELDWVLPDADLLLQCLEDMMHGLRWASAHVSIDWDAFRSQVMAPRNWQGMPPWIIGRCAGLVLGAQDPVPVRPVPLFEGAKPLWYYVRDTKARTDGLPKRRRKPLGSFLTHYRMAGPDASSPPSRSD